MDTAEYSIAKPAVISAVIITNILLNSTAIAVILRYPQLREDHTTLFVFSLTLSDLASGCITMPISAALCSKATPQVRHMVSYLPVIQQTCALWFTFVSLHSLCWVTVCKMVAITNPLRYEQLLSRKRCYGIIAFTWVAGACVAASCNYFRATWNLDNCFYTVSFVLLNSKEMALIIGILFLNWVVPVVALHYATVKIIGAVYRAHRQITAQANSIGGPSCIAGNYSTLTLHSIRSGKNVLIICFNVLLLTLPLMLLILVKLVLKENPVSSCHTFVVTWVYLFQYSANSLLYLLLFRSVRTKAIHMFSELWVNCCWIITK